MNPVKLLSDTTGGWAREEIEEDSNVCLVGRRKGRSEGEVRIWGRRLMSEKREGLIGFLMNYFKGII